jgi:hypothetical protein
VSEKGKHIRENVCARQNKLRCLFATTVKYDRAGFIQAPNPSNLITWKKMGLILAPHTA